MTLLNFFVQAIILAFTCLGSIALMLHSFLVSASSITGMKQLKSFFQDIEPVFIVIAMTVWILSQIIMISIIIKKRGTFHIYVDDYEDKWLNVFYPVILGFYISLAILISLVPGFVLGGLANIFFDESIAVYTLILTTTCIILWGIYYNRKTRNDPAPWNPEYKEWIQTKRQNNK